MKYIYINKEETERIKQILLRQSDELPYEDIERLCNIGFPNLPISIYNFENKPFEFGQSRFGGKNMIFRARLITNSNNSPFTNISEISYISNNNLNLIKNFGRANRPKHSMFYGAFDYHISCAETLPPADVTLAKGSFFFVVGMWEVISPLKLAQMPHSQRIFNDFYNTVDFVSESINSYHVMEYTKKIKNQIQSEFDYNNLVYFADEFARFDEKNSYKLSNYYAARVFNEYPQFPVPVDIDGIIYPSIVNSYQHENIVLKPLVVDNKLKFHSAMLVGFTAANSNGESAKFFPIKQNIFPDNEGNFNWSL